MKGILKGAVVVFWCSALFFIFHSKAVSQEINIGFTDPLTGPAAYIGIDAMHGAMIAAKEINDAGGVLVAGKKYKVTIRTYDDEGVGAKAVAGMQRLKDKYEVPVIIQNISGSIMAMLEKNEKMGVLLIGFFRHPQATKVGNKLVLRHQQSIEEDAMSLVKETMNLLKVKTYAMISDVSDYGKSSAKAYQGAFDKLGIKIVANEWLDQRTQTDFRGQLTKIKGANPDVIMLSAYDEAAAGVIKQAHELGIKTPFAVSTGFQAMGEKLTGPDIIEGYLKPLSYYAQLPPPPGVTRYKSQLYPAMGYKEPISMYGMACYSMVHIITQAMQKAGTTTDAVKIRQAAPTIFPINENHNLYGMKSFKEDGDGVLILKIGRYQKGKLIPIN
ncbi:MAG: ABC transporter substrate-binding protein [Deltaproteobacteria bacterium]|nr:ABC transporter substrate-binding protein [Deltaproteobacteria bacterium]